MATVKRSNPKAFEILDARIKELSGLETKVGWFATAKYENGTPVALAAAANEIGHGPTPPRPFFRPTSVKEKSSWSDLMKRGAKAIVNGKTTARTVFEALGSKVEGDVVKTISQITQPPLSPITIGLRKYKQLHPNERITGATVGKVARLLREGKLDVSGVSTKPLNETGHMIATLTSVTDKA